MKKHNHSQASLGTEWARLENNPHARQVYLNCDEDHCFCNVRFKRILDPERDPARKYYPRRDEAKTLIHWGQRKLLMSEIEFLTLAHLTLAHQQVDLSRCVVVYAGAAPGTHTPYLADMFPMLRFILVDPSRFTCRCSERIQVINMLFTDELADALREELGDRGYIPLFISDIRSVDFQTSSAAEVEAGIKRDMAAQMRWHQILKPFMSILKFRLPWEDGCTEYLAGDIYLPVWGPQSTTESRLIIMPGETRVVSYDNRRYENQMFYFNTRTRQSLYPHDIRGWDENGLDHCYDCTAEIHILTEYMFRIRKMTEGVSEAVSEMSMQISKVISPPTLAPRTLHSPNLDKAEQRERMQRRGRRRA
jgi:cap2 methyltransferase